MVTAMREVTPNGPFRIAGYSFGALIAFEIAQQLRAAGETVENLFLIEAVYDERYWPRRIWLRALLRRTRWQLTRMLRMRPTAAVAEFRLRAVRLSRRVVRRNAPGQDPLHAMASDAEVTMNSRAYGAIGQYRPRQLRRCDDADRFRRATGTSAATPPPSGPGTPGAWRSNASTAIT